MYDYIDMKFSIIIPCYNESQDIVKNVDKIKDYLASKNLDYELLLVNDGSKDNTKEVIESIPNVKALSYEPNRGKGAAIKYGIGNATGDYILFMDADLDNPASWKTMEALGGVRVKEYYNEDEKCMVVDYNIDVKNSLEKYKEIYGPYVSNGKVK